MLFAAAAGDRFAFPGLIETLGGAVLFSNRIALSGNAFPMDAVHSQSPSMFFKAIRPFCVCSQASRHSEATQRRFPAIAQIFSASRKSPLKV